MKERREERDILGDQVNPITKFWIEGRKCLERKKEERIVSLHKE